MSSQLTRSAVRIYGALSALGNGTGDVLESLLPFFDPILRKWNGQKIKPDLVAQEIRQTYNWNFNADLVETFVPYFVKNGWLSPDLPSENNSTYTIQFPDAEANDFSESGIADQLRKIALDFKQFSEHLSPLTSLPKSVEEFEDILVEWLLQIEGYSERNIEFESRLKKDETGRMSKVISIPPISKLKDDEKFLCARFVKDAIEKDEKIGEILARISSIGLLTEVVQDFVKPTTSANRTDLVIYLDAPVAMELLGVSGAAARENIEPVIQELRKIGASIRIFSQSIDEISNKLKAVLQSANPTGPTAQAMLQGQVLREYVNEVSRRPAHFLDSIGVKLTSRNLDQTPIEHRYFSQGNWQELYSRLAFIENPHARQHDTDVTALVIRHRLGRSSIDLFKSCAVLVTRNGLLAQSVSKFCRESGISDGKAIPPVVHRRFLAAAMWLRTGLGSRNFGIPKRLLLANCEQVLAIRPGVIEAVKRLTNSMDDREKSRQLDLLIAQERSVQVLMDKTLGLANVITEENFANLFSEMLGPHLEAEKMKARQAVAQVKAAASASLKSVEDQLKQKEVEIADAKEEIRLKRNEDEVAVRQLCKEVEGKINFRILLRKVLAILIALASVIPIFMETTNAVKAASFMIGAIAAYLTITGGKFVTLKFSEKDANQFLRKIAEERHMDRKLDEVFISWNGGEFQVSKKD